MARCAASTENRFSLVDKEKWHETFTPFFASCGKNLAHHSFRFANPHVQNLGTFHVHEIFLHLSSGFFPKLLGQIISGRLSDQRLPAAWWTVKQKTFRRGVLEFLEEINVQKGKLDGVFDRLPDLRIFFAENQIGWIPLFLEIADTRYERNLIWAQELLGFKPLPKPPSEYVREHCYWGFQYDPVGVELRHRINVNRLIWASDFPHQESDWPKSMSIIERNFAGVPDGERYHMVAGNAIEFFHLEN